MTYHATPRSHWIADSAADAATRRAGYARWIAKRLDRARTIAATTDTICVRDDALAQAAHYEKLTAILEDRT